MENSTAIKGIAYAASAIDMTARNTPSKAARMGIAKAASTVGNYTDGAKALWREYLACGCPRRG